MSAYLKIIINEIKHAGLGFESHIGKASLQKIQSIFLKIHLKLDSITLTKNPMQLSLDTDETPND